MGRAIFVTASKVVLGRLPAIAVCLVLVSSTGALAIPSPELVVGTLASVSQLFTMLAAMLGGGAVVAGARAKGARGMQPPRLAGWLGFGALIALVLSLYGNWYQYGQGRDVTRARLDATLLRPAHVSGMPRLDRKLRELSYSRQLRHEQGVSTVDAAKIVDQIERGDLKDTIVVDVRETAETILGTLPGAVIVRFPDLATLDVVGKKVIAYGHSGNRSHATCKVLAGRDIDCRFLAGGLEKWVAEGRPLTANASPGSSRNPSRSAAIASYPAQKALLDTAAVHNLVDDQQAIFVDVRHSSQFKLGHLPDAINLPIQWLQSAELKRQIAALGSEPIILPCYDRRSCFFANALGHKLHAAGRIVQGRYSTPWEYFHTPPPSQYVARWIEESQTGLWERSVRSVASTFQSMTLVFGLFGTIFLAALVSRLTVLPFSLKSERDQVVAAKLAPQIKNLKQKLAHDPARLSRAIRSAYRRSGLTPLRNLIALLLIPVLALFSLAFQRVSETMPTRLFWISDVALPDPHFILPLFAAALFGVYFHLAFATTRRGVLIVWLLATPLLAWSMPMLGAAVNVYILLSAVLLVAQRLIQFGARAGAIMAWVHSWKRFWRFSTPDLISLYQADLLEGRGNKAYRLARLMEAGVNVPNGVLLTGKLLAEWRCAPLSRRKKILRRAWKTVGASKVAVRSSSGAEDGEARSFAGVFESVLEVDRENFAAATEQVLQSFESERAKSYASDIGLANILVQQMVEAEYAGVMFTRDPGAACHVLVEMVEGLGEALVSGTRTPQEYRVGRVTGELVDAEEYASPIDLKSLVDIGRQAEEMFGRPQDIEWAYANGQFFILQSRDIIMSDTPSDDDLIHTEWARICKVVEGREPADVALAQTEITELLPKPTPLSLSLMQRIWSSGGSLDLACRRLGLRYTVEEDAPPYLVIVFGHTYLDKREQANRVLVMSEMSNRQLRKNADALEQGFRQDFLQPFLADMRIADAVDFDRLSTGDLLAEFERRCTNLIEDTHVEIDVVNILAQLYINDAQSSLEKLGLDAVSLLPPTQLNEFQSRLKTASQLTGDAQLQALQRDLGHRATYDYELQQPRYGEREAQLLQLAENLVGVTEGGQPPQLPDTVAGSLVAELDRARRFQILKEDAKHHAMRELAVVRRIILAIGRSFSLDDLVFYLTCEELAELELGSLAQLRALAELRQREALCFSQIPAPSFELTPASMEITSRGGDVVAVATGEIAGTRVSGSQTIRGRARVMSTEAAEAGIQIDNFQQGDIIVSRMISPAWLSHFKDAGGLVCEIGGWLSHTAVMAREYQLMMVTGVKGIDEIEERSQIEITDSGLIRIIDAKQSIAAE
ncbi:MAG: rhodanese-related sulfurtransferase/phosphohistidine swiveling domain-containing protein [Alphaproteobacteria bacterium]